MHRRRIILTAGLVAALSFAGVVGCGRDEGPAEKAGRAIDEAAQSAQEGVQDLTKEDGPLEQAGEEADEAIDRAKEKTEDALE
jgi:hypothetical protein